MFVNSGEKAKCPCFRKRIDCMLVTRELEREGGGDREKFSKRGTRRSWIFVSEKPVCLLRLNASAT